MRSSENSTCACAYTYNFVLFLYIICTVLCIVWMLNEERKEKNLMSIIFLLRFSCGKSESELDIECVVKLARDREKVIGESSGSRQDSRQL